MSNIEFAQLSDHMECDPIKRIDPKSLVGHWINSNPDTNSIARINITESNGKLQLQVFAVGPDGPIDWGTRACRSLCIRPDIEHRRRLHVHLRFRFRRSALSGNDHEGTSRAGPVSFFKDDSKRASYFLREYYAMTHEHF